MKVAGAYVPPGYVPAPGDDRQGDEISVEVESANLIRSGHHEPERWSSGICACFDDLQICCLGLWCPCYLFGRNVELLEGRPWAGPCVLHCFLWGVLAGACCYAGTPFGILGSCVSCYACGYRTALRAKYNLEDAPCGDCPTHYFCHQCAICQEYRELQQHDTNYQSVSMTGPPPVQSMTDNRPQVPPIPGSQPS